MMITVSKTALKSKMLEYFRRVEEEGEELIVTHKGVPILKVVRLPKRRKISEVFADLQGKMKYGADIMEAETEEWGDV